jgi:LacI family transcriptional regulator
VYVHVIAKILFILVPDTVCKFFFRIFSGMQKKRSRIKDIAERAGVSIGTVDRVLHNRPEVASETRDRVRSIMREMNYEPDILARTLVSNKSWRFAAILPGTFHQTSFWQKPLDGMMKAVREIGHFGVSLDSYLFDIFDRHTFVEQGQEILKKKPDGLIIAPVFARDSFRLINQCKELQIPVVLINSEIKVKYPLSFIGQDSWQSGRVAAQMINYLRKPDTAIGIIHLVKELGEQKHIEERERGFRDFFKSEIKEKIEILPALTIPDFGKDKVDEFILSYLEQFKNVSTLFITNSNVYKVAHCFETNGIRGIHLAGYDLIAENRNCLGNGQIDFLIEQKPEEQGYRGIMTLFNSILLRKEVEYRQFLPVDIVIKENLKYYTQ